MIRSSSGTLQRTYANQLRLSMDGEPVTVLGWVMATRTHGKIAFLTLRDKTGTVQIVAKKGSCSDATMSAISDIKIHSSVSVNGLVKMTDKAPCGVEVVLSNLRILSPATATPPFEPQAKTVKNIDTRLTVRSIDLRRDALWHVFQARSRLLYAVRGDLHNSGFTEISTPKMISTATEGGAALFPIFYYNKQAFLAQSPQLYKEQLVMSFESVFEIAPIFRAESSRTNRHLAEAISIDIENAFADYGDIMDIVEDIISISIKTVSEYAMESGAEMTIPKMPSQIPRHSYSDIVSKLQDAGSTVQWGDDLYPQMLRKAGLKNFYFITDWPLGPKPFYVKVSKSDPRLSESFDLMFDDLEISSGSTRIEEREELEARMKNKGMDAGQFEYHLRAFDFGMPPHAGCGIGLERLMMALTGIENIRDATFYPRDADRLTP